MTDLYLNKEGFWEEFQVGNIYEITEEIQPLMRKIFSGSNSLFFCMHEKDYMMGLMSESLFTKTSQLRNRDQFKAFFIIKEVSHHHAFSAEGNIKLNQAFGKLN